MSASPWNDLVKPHVQRFKLAAVLGHHVSFNAKGCEAMASLMQQMADTLDNEIARQRAATAHFPPPPSSAILP
jgi:hypothetical protein